MATINKFSLEENEYLNDSEKKKLPNRWGKRHTLIVLSALSYGVFYMMASNLNVVMIAMTDVKGNTSSQQVFDWDKKTQNLIMASFFLGLALVMIPIGNLTLKFSPKKIVIVALVSASAISAAFPFIAKIGGAYAACGCRLMLGVMMASIAPASFAMIGKWIPLDERGKATAFSQTGGQFGKVLGMASAGWLASTSFGWTLVFYTSALISFVVAMLYIIFVESSPDEHPTISKEELLYIKKFSGSSFEKKKPKTPWKNILSSLQVFLIMINFIGYLWILNTMVVETPSYLKNILGMEIKSGGFLASLPFAATGTMSVVYSSIFDYLIAKKKISLITARKASNTIGFWLSGILLVIFSFIPANQPALSMCMLVATLSSVGAANSGFLVMPIDIAPNFSGITLSIVHTVGSFAAFIAPIVSGLILTDVTDVTKWRFVFILAAGILFIGNLFLLIFGSSEVLPWNNYAESDEVFADAKELQTLNGKSNETRE